jgi:hypothetical protein
LDSAKGSDLLFPSIPIADLKLNRRSTLVIPARISYFALLMTTTCAALRKESRMQIIKATGLDRKSGGTQPRDLRFPSPSNSFRSERELWLTGKKFAPTAHVSGWGK